MYWFNIQDILKDYKELTFNQLKIEHTFRYGFCNRNSLQKNLSKLVNKGIVKRVKKKDKETNITTFYYHIAKR